MLEVRVIFTPCDGTNVIGPLSISAPENDVWIYPQVLGISWLKKESQGALLRVLAPSLGLTRDVGQILGLYEQRGFEIRTDSLEDLVAGTLYLFYGTLQ